jgi:hypothetical protein
VKGIGILLIIFLDVTLYSHAKPSNHHPKQNLLVVEELRLDLNLKRAEMLESQQRNVPFVLQFRLKERSEALEGMLLLAQPLPS